MKTATTANKLILNSAFNKEKFKAFILTYRTFRTSIVKDISQHIDEAGIMEFLWILLSGSTLQGYQSSSTELKSQD